MEELQKENEELRCKNSEMFFEFEAEERSLQERLKRANKMVLIVKEVKSLDAVKYGKFSVITKLEELKQSMDKALEDYDAALALGTPQATESHEKPK